MDNVLRRPAGGTRRRLIGGRLAVVLFASLTTLALIIPAISLASLELERRSLLVERTVREAELRWLQDELDGLEVTAPVLAAPSAAP